MRNPVQSVAAVAEIQAHGRAATTDEIGKIVIIALRKAGFELRPTANVRNPVRTAARERGTKRSNSGQARVLHIIQQYPGSRGFQIVVRSAETGHPINERTVRTALARLKRRCEIEIREDGGWYPTEVSK